MVSWIENDFKMLDLGDQRLNKRCMMIVESLSKNLERNVGSSFNGYNETAAAYRFFDNENTRFEEILKPHQYATQERLMGMSSRRILHIQDTSELDFTKKITLDGSGPLNSKERTGFFLHPQLLLDTEGLMLGIWAAELFSRTLEEHGKASERKSKPIEEKESHRWLQGYEQACLIARDHPDKQIISISDREADIYEIYDCWQKTNQSSQKAADWIIRCSIKNRRILEAEEKNIYDKICAAPLLQMIEVPVQKAIQYKKVKGGNRKKSIRSARNAQLATRACEVMLHPPFRKGRRFDPIKVWVVMAKETNPPEGEEPIEWVLLTSIPVHDFPQAKDIIECYRLRWEIEVYFKTLKSGCQVEKLGLKTRERMEVAIALYMIIAWRLLFLTKLNRIRPDLKCDCIFEKIEWETLWIVIHGKNKFSNLKESPKLCQIIQALARLGGHLGRKSDAPPGATYLWRGLQALKYIVLTAEALK